MLFAASRQQNTAHQRSELRREGEWTVVVGLCVCIVLVRLSAHLYRGCSYGVYVWILDFGMCWEWKIHGDGERVEGEEANGIRFGGVEKQRLPEMLLSPKSSAN